MSCHLLFLSCKDASSTDLTGCNYSKALPTYGRAELDVTAEGWLDSSDREQTVAQGTLNYLGATTPSAFTILPRLVDSLDVAALRAMADAQPFDLRPDSVDAQPAHELYILKDGVTVLADLHVQMAAALSRLSRFVNRRLTICQSAPTRSCRPCTALIRRYRPDERRAHHEHVDGHAAVTAVVSLSRAAEYVGGLYLSNLSSRTFLPLERGDAVVHMSDVFHGVDVLEGERWSLVVWFLTCARCTLGDATTWWRARAEAGEPFAQFLHSRTLLHAHRADGAARAAAAHWLTQSATNSFLPAMHLLGQAHASGEGGVPYPCQGSHP